MPEVRGVWSHEAGGSRMWLTVSIKQQYAGHSKQAGFIASQCHAGAYANRFVVVVDDDIDPADMDKVIWAICTRCDPREDFEILRGCWTGTSDPMNYGAATSAMRASSSTPASRGRGATPFRSRSDRARSWTSASTRNGRMSCQAQAEPDWLSPAVLPAPWRASRSWARFPV